MLACQVLAPLQAVALKTCIAGKAREPIEQLIGRAFRFLLQQPLHQVRQRQRLFAAVEHLTRRQRRPRCVSLALAACPRKLCRLRLEAGQGIDVGFDLAG